MGQYRWVMYSYILLHYHQYPQPQTFCLLHNMWILPLSYLVQLEYLSTISLYSLFFGKFVLLESFQLWKLPLSLWILPVWFLPKIQQGQQEGVGTIHTHTFTWSCLWWWNSVCTCRNAPSPKSGKLQLLKGSTHGKARECHHSNITKTLMYLRPVLSPTTHPWSLICRRLLHHWSIAFINWISYCSPLIWTDSVWFGFSV